MPGFYTITLEMIIRAIYLLYPEISLLAPSSAYASVNCLREAAGLYCSAIASTHWLMISVRRCRGDLRHVPHPADAAVLSERDACIGHVPKRDADPGGWRQRAQGRIAPCPASKVPGENWLTKLLAADADSVREVGVDNIAGKRPRYRAVTAPSMYSSGHDFRLPPGLRR